MHCRWFAAENHRNEINAFVASWVGDRSHHMLDLFGASRKMQYLSWKSAPLRDWSFWSLHSFIASYTPTISNPFCFPLAPARRQWRVSGYVGQSFDIKISDEHDLVTRRGCFCLLEMTLKQLVSSFYEYASTIFSNHICCIMLIYAEYCSILQNHKP